MRLQRYHLRPVSSIGTPLKADTLAGQLLCLYAEKHGPEAMDTLIAQMRSGEVPFVISDAFPAGSLPGPILPDLSRKQFESILQKRQSGEHSRFELLKRLKQFRQEFRFLSLEQWGRFRKGLSLSQLFEESLSQPQGEDSGASGAWKQESRSELHNIIDRHSGRTLSEGGLFTTDTTWFAQGDAGAELDLYVATREEAWAAEVGDLLQRLGQVGFGRDASTGKGHFTLRGPEDAAELLDLQEANAWMTLSTCATQQPGAVQGSYRLRPKFGKVWSGFGQFKPFKKPLLMFESGSVFTTYPQGWGQGILPNIHRSDPAIIQHATALLVPVLLAPSEAS